MRKTTKTATQRNELLCCGICTSIIWYLYISTISSWMEIPLSFFCAMQIHQIRFSSSLYCIYKEKEFFSPENPTLIGMLIFSSFSLFFLSNDTSLSFCSCCHCQLFVCTNIHTHMNTYLWIDITHGFYPTTTIFSLSVCSNWILSISTITRHIMSISAVLSLSHSLCSWHFPFYPTY